MHKLKLILVLVFFMNGSGFCQTIHDLAKAGDLTSVTSLLKGEPTLLNAGDENGYTPLHWALIRAKWKLAEYLIDQGADLNASGNDGGTPLHCAANHENTRIVEMMLRKGAVVDPKNLWGNTPLALAAQRGCNSIIEILIKHGADVNSLSLEKWTPLHYANKAGHKEMVSILLKNGASESIVDNFGKKPGDYVFNRPERCGTDPGILNCYVGFYYVGPGTYFNVTLEGGTLQLEDVALDEIYPIAPDQFYDYREPWKIRFFRNHAGEVDIIAVDFQRQTVIGKKVKSKHEIPLRPKLGIASRPLKPGDIAPEILNLLFFDLKVASNAQLVTQVGEDTPADKAGLAPNDIIVEFNTEPLLQAGDLIRLLYQEKVGHKIKLKVLRDKETIFLTIILM